MTDRFIPPARVRLVAPLKQTDSGSAAFLGLASDGRQYWIKPPGNPQGSRTLVAEAVAYGLGRLIAAPVPSNVLVEIPSEMRWSYAPAHWLNGGVGHGSENIVDVVVADDWGVYSGRDDNRGRQAFIFALWALCLGVDPQWLHQVSDDYSIWTFDHGFWLAGEADWDIASLTRIGTNPWQYELDPGVASADALREAAHRLEKLDLATIRGVTEAVPLEWGTTPQELSQLAAVLMMRAEGVAERLRAAAELSRYP